MSMTYYAVTDDPNELAHWGIKGMKWGVRHDKPRHSGSRRPRSAAYRKAQSKLGKMMKSGIKKAEAHWKTYNSPQAKEERFMKKAIQQARNGTLKYGKLTDAQVRKVTDRLALERNARQLGSTENPSYAKRIKTAIGEGIVRGIGQGTGAYIEERFRGRGRTTAEIKADKRMDKYKAKTKTQERKQKRKIAEEYYDVTADENYRPTHITTKGRAKYLAEVKARNKKNEYSANIQKIHDEQEARSRALSDSRAYDDIQRGIRSTSNERKLGKGTGLAKLNSWNEAHENVNKHGNAYLDSVDKELAVIKKRNSTSTNRQFATNQVMQEYAKTQRQRTQEAEVRRKALQQKEQARLARAKEVKGPNPASSDFERRKSDMRNMSSYRKRQGKR